MPGPGRRFPKGQSGNPSGRPKLDQTITELARAHGPRAIEVFAELMNDAGATASVRAMAAEKLLDRGYGRGGRSFVRCSMSNATTAMKMHSGPTRRTS